MTMVDFSSKRRPHGRVRFLVALALASTIAVTGAGLAVTASPAAAVTIGTVNMDGNALFDSDSLADSSATQYRWQSYPGSRLSLNANQASNVKAPAGPMNNRLGLDVGGWFGTTALNMNSIVRTEMATSGGSANVASSVSTTWYPNRIGMSATYATPSSTSVGGYDFMVDANSTIVRVINVTSSVNNDVVLSGAITGSGGGQWIGGSSKVVLVSDAKYYYAIHVVSLSGSTLAPVELAETATISGGEWSYRKAFTGSGNLGVSIGFAALSEGSATAIARATGAFSQPVATTLAQTKAAFDGWLRDVPAPANWGVSGITDYGVTAQQHKNMYYSAWVFLLQDLVNALPENASTYPYPQVLAGKPSLWNVGSSGNPGTAQWESVFGYQQLSFLMPETAWQSYLGLLSQVDSNGMIGGESLPTRLAQTAWVLYQNSGSTSHLSTAYPALKRFLDWAEDNPRWICCGHNIPEEKDIEFVSSWLFDTEFAIKIATQLGLTADVTMWQNKRTAMLANLNPWFFKDADVIYGNAYPYTAIPPAWSVGNDSFKATALSISGLTTTQLGRLKGWFMSIHHPNANLDNFHFHKYPDVSLTIYGLLNNGGDVQAKEYTQAAVRDAIRGKQFAEVLIPTSTGLKTDSVAPSLFTATEIIELTWLLNGLRYDSGSPTAFSFGTSSLTVPNSPDVLPMIESFDDVSDWSNPLNAFISADSGAGMIRFEDVAGGAYGVVQKSVAMNVDDYPKLSINIGALYEGAQWALKVNDGSGDITLQADTSATGVQTYDLRSVTGWSGGKTFTLRLYAIGGKVKVQEISAPYVALETFTSPTGWATSNATFEPSGGIAKVTTTAAYGRVKKSFTYNVDDFPKLVIKTTEVGGGSQWSLKVNDGSGDIALQADTSTTGELVYNLKSVTGWSGSKTFDVVIYAINGSGSYVKVDYVARAR